MNLSAVKALQEYLRHPTLQLRPAGNERPAMRSRLVKKSHASRQRGLRKGPPLYDFRGRRLSMRQIAAELGVPRQTADYRMRVGKLR